MKQRLKAVRDFLIYHSKIVFPIVLIAVVALTVSLALGTKESPITDDVDGPGTIGDVLSNVVPSLSEDETQDESDTEEPGEIPLMTDLDMSVKTLIYTYYDALARGDADTISGITNVMDEMERIKIQELGNYIELYPTVEIFYKPGPLENTFVVFVYTKATFTGFEEQVAGFQTFYICADEEGNYFLNEGELEQEIVDYISEMIYHEDVVELYNKVEVEYNDVMEANPTLLAFLAAMESDIRTATGLIIAGQITEGEQTGDGTGDVTGEGETGDGGNEDTQQPEQTYIYATATATVNVRESDSAEADKLGKLEKGKRILILEQRPNGWCKVSYENQEGFIKSEYLKIVESADDLVIAGNVKAKTAVNIRSDADKSSGKLGVFQKGDTLPYVEVVGEWYKVIYNGQVGYVNSDYATVQ